MHYVVHSHRLPHCIILRFKVVATVEAPSPGGCAAASSGKCVVARTVPWLEPGSPP